MQKLFGDQLHFTLLSALTLVHDHTKEWLVGYRHLIASSTHLLISEFLIKTMGETCETSRRNLIWEWHGGHCRIIVIITPSSVLHHAVHCKKKNKISRKDCRCNYLLQLTTQMAIPIAEIFVLAAWCCSISSAEEYSDCATNYSVLEQAVLETHDNRYSILSSFYSPNASLPAVFVVVRYVPLPKNVCVI